MNSRLLPSPLQSLRVSRHQIPAYQLIPNTSIQRKPLLIYHAAFPPDHVDASSLESHVRSIGVVVPQWRYSMYTTSHFHSNTHEVSMPGKLCKPFHVDIKKVHTGPLHSIRAGRLLLRPRVQPRQRRGGVEEGRCCSCAGRRRPSAG